VRNEWFGGARSARPTTYEYDGSPPHHVPVGGDGPPVRWACSHLSCHGGLEQAKHAEQAEQTAAEARMR